MEASPDNEKDKKASKDGTSSSRNGSSEDNELVGQPWPSRFQVY